MCILYVYYAIMLVSCIILFYSEYRFCTSFTSRDCDVARPHTHFNSLLHWFVNSSYRSINVQMHANKHPDPFTRSYHWLGQGKFDSKCNFVLWPVTFSSVLTLKTAGLCTPGVFFCICISLWPTSFVHYNWFKTKHKAEMLE